MNNRTMLQTEPGVLPFPIDEVPVFQQGVTYTGAQLDQIATHLCYRGRVAKGEDLAPDDGMLLSRAQWYTQTKHELLCESGGPDPAYTTDRFGRGRHVHGIYWRTHPGGRGFHTLEERRESKMGFYT